MPAGLGSRPVDVMPPSLPARQHPAHGAGSAPAVRLSVERGQRATNAATAEIWASESLPPNAGIPPRPLRTIASTSLFGSVILWRLGPTCPLVPADCSAWQDPQLPGKTALPAGPEPEAYGAAPAWLVDLSSAITRGPMRSISTRAPAATQLTTASTLSTLFSTA